MGYITEGFTRAFELLASFDEETYSAVFTTIRVSAMSMTASLMIGIPAGFTLGYFSFPAKRHVRTVVDTLLAMPTVVVGLVVYAFISRKGPLGSLELLYTQPGIAVAQTILVLPIVVSLTAAAVEGLDRRLGPTLHALGARGVQVAVTSLVEARHAVLIAAVTAYGRAMSEVGVSMIVGGNIKWHTRTITTAIALETGKGEFGMAIALGLVLLLLASVVNGSLAALRRRSCM